ncbi:S-layer homology domain-containing protein [Bacillus ndiopicus]|uniref:S-layer homology domain-containing protein n=1 Tax=Bacillus ndiopicus TaxID=1347368 RepID=UPI0005A718C0|nr:S-layer homology domain-containing protein [Bacillus ndiopicus]
MKKKYYTVAVASLAAAAVAVAPASAAQSFTDVAKNNAHYEAITALHTAGIISGYQDGTFKPAQDVTRGQAAKIIAGALGLDTKNIEDPKFADIPKSHQYYGPIAALAALDAMEIYEDNTIEPNETITRGELAYMISQALGLDAEGDSPFTDVPADSDYAYFVTALYEYGIANGISETEFGVEESVTRGQLATFIFNVMNELTEVEEPSTTTEDTATVEQTTTDTALLETVFTKATEKQLATESLKAAITMAQSMVIQDGEEAVTVDADIKMDMSIVNKPMSFFAEGTVAMIEPTTGEAMEMPIKMYMTEKDGMYMYEGLTETWVKYPSEMFDEILAQTGAQVNAAEQLEMLKKFSTDIKIKEANGYYILTLTGAGDKFTELVQEQMGALNLGLDEEALAEVKNMKFDTFTYEIKINKETFDIEEMVMNFGFGMNSEGIKMDVTNKSTIKYSDYNTVSTITIPKEVLEKAKSMDELDFSAIEETEAK